MQNRRTVVDLSVPVLLLGVFIVLSYLLVALPRQEDIHGVWKGEHLGRELVFRFNRDGTCVLSFLNNASGSLEVLSGRFEMDISKTPIPLSVRDIPQLNYPLHTIVQFMGDDAMMIAHFASRWRIRPISFDPDTSMRLRRVDEDE